jgi:hypothetical protein
MILLVSRASRGKNSPFKSTVVWFGLAKPANEYGESAAKTLHRNEKSIVR